MDEDLLSKKELLDLTDISYGQLYRWKRKNLIPEDWFIRKSTFTGQETFFPKERILQRIEQIKNMKDGLSLDELADMFSPNPADISLSRQTVLEQNIVTNVALDVFLTLHPETNTFSFQQLLYTYAMDIGLRTGDINRDEAKLMVETLESDYQHFEHRNCKLLLIRKMGVATSLLLLASSEVYWDTGVRVVFELDMAQTVEELKLKIA